MLFNIVIETLYIIASRLNNTFVTKNLVFGEWLMSNRLFMSDKSHSRIIFLNLDGKSIPVEVIFKDEKLWLPHCVLADLLDATEQEITQHLVNMHAHGELDAMSCSTSVQLFSKQDGSEVSEATRYYNLDALIALSLRIQSTRAISFRKWATRLLSDYIVKGFVMDDKHLKHPDYFLSVDYFADMLERISDIRESSRTFYQKLTDIYAQCSVDYSKNAAITLNFYKRVSCRLYWAISQHLDIISGQADAIKPDFEKTDNLQHLVSMYLDYAQSLASNGIGLTMAAWVARIDVLLQFNKEDLLYDPQGMVCKAITQALSINDYELYKTGWAESYQSDYDSFIDLPSFGTR